MPLSECPWLLRAWKKNALAQLNGPSKKIARSAAEQSHKAIWAVPWRWLLERFGTAVRIGPRSLSSKTVISMKRWWSKSLARPANAGQRATTFHAWSGQLLVSRLLHGRLFVKSSKQLCADYMLYAPYMSARCAHTWCVSMVLITTYVYIYVDVLWCLSAHLWTVVDFRPSGSLDSAWSASITSPAAAAAAARVRSLQGAPGVDSAENKGDFTLNWIPAEKNIWNCVLPLRRTRPISCCRQNVYYFL